MNVICEETSYTNARNHLAELMDKVSKERNPVFIKRRGAEKVAMLPADDLSALLETCYLLSSPKNTERILSALKSARANKGAAFDLNAYAKKQQIELTD